ncbi:DUF6056 family protein [Paenibacillus sp. B01]|uniref:DUF6056 family protein n=1 Tax=Paenibacillus sp. B01 TaxID=2660554 RepID=UPI00129B0F06|nr:DUF6056 family protein [Paenibacillus sp. B01]QGG58193.1 hypothetical protein GE073_23175 [Paenibacillus sp. B01]
MVLNKKSLLYISLIYVALLAIHLQITLSDGSDDIHFANIEGSLFEWIAYRYQNWSSRLFSETLFYLILGHGVWFWKLFNPLIIFLLSYAMIRLLKKEVDLKDFLLSLTLIGFLSKPILSSSFFWITGSLVYLWPITIGLFVLIPYSDHLFRGEAKLSFKKFLLFLFLVAMSCLSNEQMILCVTAFAVLTHISRAIEKKKQDKYLLVLTSAMVIGLIFVLTAPGNDLRFASEVKSWYPGFDDLSLKDHVYVGVIWMYDKLFNQMNILITFTSAVIIWILFKNGWYEKKNILPYIFLVLFSINIAMSLTEFYGYLFRDFNQIKNFNFLHTTFDASEWNIKFFSALIPYIFWSLYLILLMILSIKVSHKKVLSFFLFMSAISAMAVMFFSPTIFVSGNRVLTVSAIIILFLNIKMIKENGLDFPKPMFLLISVFSVVNLIELVMWWNKDGVYLIMY